MTKLFIISNESVFSYDGKFFCDNIDMKSTPEGLNKDFEVNIIARKSKKKRSHKIELLNVKIYKNIFLFLLGVLKTIKKEDSKYLIFSITPFTLLASILIKIFKKKSIVYLRSDGFGEYKSIFGLIGPIIFSFMFFVVSKISTLVSCNKYILHGKKGEIVLPSQLDDLWLANINKPTLEKNKLLFVGRIKKEKGIYSLIDILKSNNQLNNLTIVGAENKINKENFKNINIIEIIKNKKELIDLYDEHNIFVLPSYTEGHPMVLLESLARLRPVIVFDEINHVAKNKKGVFVSSRNADSFFKKIDYIMNNYDKIQSEMKKNILPENKQFISDLKRIIVNL